MKRLLFAALALSLLLVLSGCGSDHPSSPPVFHTRIASDAAVDGYVVDGVTAFLGTPSIFAGIDPVGGVSEARAFLDFPTASVPADAFIESATLDFVIDSIQPSQSVPIMVELVAFPPPLAPEDFGAPPLTATVVVQRIFPVDVQATVDVTPLVRFAQSLRRQNTTLTDFQFRISQQSGPPVRIGIDESSNQNAPLLFVDYSR